MKRSLALLATVSLAGPALADAGEADEVLRELARAQHREGELLRVGLPAAHEIEIDCRGAYRLVDADAGSPVWRERFAGKIVVVAEGGPKDGVRPQYRVQVGAFATEEAARGELARLEQQFGTTGVVHRDPDRGNWRVRLGREDDRLALSPLVDRLRAAGIAGIWIAEEPRQPPGDVQLRLVDQTYASTLVPARRIAVVPLGEEPIAVSGKRYRGVVELRVSRFGTVQPIDWIELEHYLLGVVPAELGPEQWPQLAALQAQAIAARTYAQANLGQFSEHGYDVCATPRCQAYEGYDAEHPLSTRAVWSTKGEILTWKGAPIAALYTSTCGGHTENGEEIFPEHDEPYLRGVACAAEGEALESQRGQLQGRGIEPVVDETGSDVTRDWALLEVAGVLRGPSDAAADASSLRRWTRALAGLAGRPAPEGEPPQAASLAELAVLLVGDLGWEQRAAVLLSSSDVPALLRDPTLATLPEPQRRALAYLTWAEGLRPHADGKLHAEAPATAARMAPGLVRIGESYEAFGLRTGTVSRVAGKQLELAQGKGSVRLSLDAGAALFGRVGGRAVPAERLDLWPGDSVRFRTSAAGAIDFLELEPPVKGVSDDRTAKLYSWEVRRSRREIEAAINRSVSIGQLQGLRVVRRGVSGRAVELEVTGSAGSTVIHGFDVRRLLDLRESLLVIEPQYDAAGTLDAVVFAGKGWGHGVGLCQVGAYGMALRGRSYREILTHYYRGAEIAELRPAAR